jgi:hypothetical protein
MSDDEPLPGDELLAEIDDMPPGLLNDQEMTTLRLLCSGVEDVGRCPTRMAAIDQIFATARVRARTALAEAEARPVDDFNLVAAYGKVLAD